MGSTIKLCSIHGTGIVCVRDIAKGEITVVFESRYVCHQRPINDVLLRGESMGQ